MVCRVDTSAPEQAYQRVSSGKFRYRVFGSLWNVSWNAFRSFPNVLEFCVFAVTRAASIKVACRKF